LLRIEVVHSGYLPHDGDAERAERASEGLESSSMNAWQQRPSVIRAPSPRGKSSQKHLVQAEKMRSARHGALNRADRSAWAEDATDHENDMVSDNHISVHA
jgi:hypothetical protein